MKTAVMIFSAFILLSSAIFAQETQQKMETSQSLKEQLSTLKAKLLECQNQKRSLGSAFPGKIIGYKTSSSSTIYTIKKGKIPSGGIPVREGDEARNAQIKVLDAKIADINKQISELEIKIKGLTDDKADNK
jgi:chaperonin cofactor prefoldin